MTRTKIIPVYFTKEEFEVLRKYAFKNELKISPFIRSVSLDKIKQEGKP